MSPIEDTPLHESLSRGSSRVEGPPSKAEPSSTSPASSQNSQIGEEASTLKKSDRVSQQWIPLPSAPILTAPNIECEAFAVASIDASGHVVENSVYSFVLKGEEIKEEVLDGWMNNLREIEEYVRALLSSPVYLQLQNLLQAEIMEKKPSSIESSSAVGGGGKIALLETMDHWRHLERTSIDKSASSQDSGDTKLLVIPLTATMLACGGIAGLELVHFSDVSGGIVQFVEHLQPLFPTVPLQEVLSFVNLMLVGPLYFNSWNEAVGKLTNKEHKSVLAAIVKFAQDVLKIAAEGSVVQSAVLKWIKGASSLSLQEIDKLTTMLKVVLVGVAMSLLYSAEVGKVSHKEFWGMEMEELRSLLLGKFQPQEEEKTPTTALTSRLIEALWRLLEPLAKEERAQAVDLLLSYVGEKRDVESMLSPAKVFEAAVKRSQFNLYGHSQNIMA